MVTHLAAQITAKSAPKIAIVDQSETRMRHLHCTRGDVLVLVSERSHQSAEQRSHQRVQ